MSGTIAYEEVLNPSQLEAVMTLKGPVLVIAGAGSGKTRTLVYRVARLVETGIPPESILLLTFTRKAAHVMLERAAELSDPRCRFVSGGTFHSLAYQVLKSHSKLLGFHQSFTILDRSDMEEVIQSLVPELGIPKGSGRFPKRHTLANILSKAANLQRTTEDLMAEEYAHFMEALVYINRLAELYSDYKKVHHMMDYDDLIIYFRQVLAESNEVRKELGRKYRYIMVDEYQDTNTIQADIVGWMADEHRNVMVVGDDSQAIYSFRGADYRNMFDFPSKFPESKCIKLEQNYRSTQPILTLTNSLMEQAREKYTKCLFTKRSEGELPALVDTLTEPQQAGFISRYIGEDMRKHRPLTDFAVLFRAAHHSFELEVELARQGIPFVKYGGFKFMESAHIKDLLAHIRVVVNRDDAVSWGRILRLIEHIGPTKSNAIMHWIRAEQVPANKVSEWPKAGKTDRKGLEVLSRLLSGLATKGLSPEEGVKQVMAYYNPVLEKKFDDFPRRKRDLESLLTMARRYGSLKAFLDDLALEPPTSSADLDPGGKGEALTLSTVHSAKGLEWPVVFIIWATEGRFPLARSFSNPESIEEERRLMYVAATRAKDRLIICYPGRESAGGAPLLGVGGMWGGNGLSSFIAALPSEVMNRQSVEDGRDKDSSRSWYSRESAPVFEGQGGLTGLRQGERVRHPAFGTGVIAKVVGNDKVEVLFKNSGRKLLHLGYTTLERA